MEVTGDMGNVVNALMSATMRIAEHANDFEQLGHVDYAFAQNGMSGPMPDDYSAVLGKGGKILADIRNHTGCSASIATDVSENEDPTVTVRGPVAGVHRCQALVLERALMHASQ